ncbi:MAG: hypothetical protein BEN18_10915 [Epulopiscium sp. Nuni2H_MBin001]|nr:MAG: hypothetical protein BEN18_10915 [Epulopiscium sp. Nuni2H_MBin001]
MNEEIMCECKQNDAQYMIAIIIAYLLLTHPNFSYADMTDKVFGFNVKLGEGTWIVALLGIYFLYQYDLI